MNEKFFGEKHNVAKDTKDGNKRFHRYREMLRHQNCVFFGTCTCIRGEVHQVLLQ